VAGKKRRDIISIPKPEDVELERFRQALKDTTGQDFPDAFVRDTFQHRPDYVDTTIHLATLINLRTAPSNDTATDPTTPIGRARELLRKHGA
jgi:hypothetical protein